MCLFTGSDSFRLLSCEHYILHRERDAGESYRSIARDLPTLTR